MTTEKALDDGSLRGKFVRFHHESKVSKGHLVTSHRTDGVVELDDLPGEFAEHLFERIDRPHTAAPGNS